jgi:hypothetical protein
MAADALLDAARAMPWLIAALELYLTEFLKGTFEGEIAQNCAFCGG